LTAVLRAQLASAILGAALGATACHETAPAPNGDARSSAPPKASQAAPSAAANPPAVSASARAPVAPPVTAAAGCRVLEVKTPAPALAGTPLHGTLLHDFSWFDLAKGVELTLKHSETLREFRLLGPGRFVACPAGEESVFVARGSVTTTAGPGSRAGAEVTLATPFGVVEYPDAELRLDVADAGLTLAVQQGAATLVENAKPGARAPAARTVRAPSGHAQIHGRLDDSALVARCKDAQERIASKTAAPAPSALADRGRWAVARMQERKAARLACASARAAIGRLEEPERTQTDDQLTGRIALKLPEGR
jgi:hypothetical protein